MILQAVVLVTLTGLAASTWDKDLHAKYLTMPRDKFIEYFNNQDYSWKMTQNDDINLQKHAACALIDSSNSHNFPLVTHDVKSLKDLPTNFDSREKWPQCETIKEIYSQGHCGSCWTFGTATTASDRTCIHKNIHVRLAEQDFECLQDDVCGGGYPYLAFEYWKKTGLVTQKCKPYDIEELHKNICEHKCVTSDKDYKKDKHFADSAYFISNESDQIKAELTKNGPIQATFVVFDDFFSYKSGVYVHQFGNASGMHSVRVIGYGVENGIDYWLVANSWAETWGDHGWFKIKSYQKEIQFEKYLCAGLPKN